LPTLPVGTVFQVNVTPFDTLIPPQTVFASLMNPEANSSTTPPNDFIVIPNPATANLQPSGFGLVDAKVGQTMTVSWSLPTFEVSDVELTANVSPFSGPGPRPFCSIQPVFLPRTATSGSFKFPTSCFGQPVGQAQFCIFITGTGGEKSNACWFFDDPS
jgi:hypothetical protein